MKLMLLRHGTTAGNLEKRYIGRTDEPLCTKGIAALSALHYPESEVLICSPMQRCIQTAQILFPAKAFDLCSDFRECDFGEFEGKNYQELNGNASYQRWIESGGVLPFPAGESPSDFRSRCCHAFAKMMHIYAEAASLCMVVHGGTVMSVLAQYADPHRDYYDWMTENGHGWLCRWEAGKIQILEKL